MRRAVGWMVVLLMLVTVVSPIFGLQSRNEVAVSFTDDSGLAVWGIQGSVYVSDKISVYATYMPFVSGIFAFEVGFGIRR